MVSLPRPSDADGSIAPRPPHPRLLPLRNRKWDCGPRSQAGSSSGLESRSERTAVKSLLLPLAVASQEKSWDHVEYGEYPFLSEKLLLGFKEVGERRAWGPGRLMSPVLSVNLSTSEKSKESGVEAGDSLPEVWGRVSEHLFNLKFAAKELNRNAKKCDKEEKAEKAKIKSVIQKGNTEVARIHAENAIRQKNQTINFLRMSARVDAVAARVQTAVTMGKVTRSMAGVVKSMDATLRSMNLEKISALMDKFEQQFETLDGQTQQMEDTMSSTTTLTTPQNQVDMLLQEMADEAGLDLSMELPQGQTGSFGTSVASMEQDELSQRLARLRDQV
ncbi:charged multivesicular body protein 1B2-like [Mesoplodon densirostris]|uniref:charged multivesicular body protein 1B2-like n=1 Tax=Mesoplodon densirostris TaxID=48708 RepID=UPI0028DC79E2|nr:charged multivesicular body protein 1B2-like [Mesoplodon densirostris]